MNLISRPPMSRRYPLARPLRGYKHLAFWLAALALLPLSLLVYGVHVTHEASVESTDVNQSGSLRFRSLLIYGVTNQSRPTEAWRPVLTKMASIRESLRIRYPQAVGQTDIAWNTFFGSLQRSGHVDWQTSLQMRDAADRLTQYVEDAAKMRHDRANRLFLAGIMATALFSGFALVGARKGRRAEQARAQSEERFRVLFEHSSDAHLLFDDTGIIDCNNAAVQMLRCQDKAEVLSLHPAVLSPERQPDGRRSLEKCVEMDAIARQQGYHRFEWMHRTMDGNVFPVEVTLTPVTLGDKDTLLVVWHDLTTRKQNELALQQSHAKMTALIEAIPDVLYRVNREGICLDDFGRNKLHSYITAEEIVGKPLRDFVPSHVGDMVQGGINAALATHTMQTLQYTIRMDGKTRHRDARVVAQSDDVALIVIRDVTDSKAMENELRLNEARFDAFLNQGSMVAWITDGEGRIEYVNEPYCDMIGRSPQDCLGKTAFDLFPADAAQVLLDNIVQVAQTGQFLETEETVPLPDGRLHHFLVHKFLLRDLDGRILVGGSAIDITVRKDAEEALQTNEERLREAQQIARIGSWERNLVTDRILWSEEMYRLFRFDPAEGVPNIERMLARVHPDDRETYLRATANASENAEHYDLPLRLLFEDGTITWGHTVGKLERDVTGKIVRRFGTFMDVTMQKQTEMALRQNQENLNRAQAMAHVGSWERDYRTGTMAWSDELFRLCGLEPGSVAPSIEALLTYTHPLDQQRAQETMRQAMQSGKGAKIDVRLVGADGVLRHVSICTEILKEDTGQTIGSRGTLTDVTERAKALQEQTKFVSLIENSSDFIAMASLEGVMLSMNAAGRKMVGLEEAVVSTRMLSDLVSTEVWDWLRQGVLPTVLQGERWDGECQVVNVETGMTHDTQASFFLIRNPIHGEPMCLATVQRDITDQKWLDAQLRQNVVHMQEQNLLLDWQRQQLATANAHLKALATTDGLTGAKNHRAFQEILAEEFTRAERSHDPFSVILLDVDKFKQYNDSFGHPEGDRVLQQVVQVLQDTARNTDCVARYGGEEFIVLLPETGIKGAREAAERFRAAIETHDWPLRPVTASFGVATLNTTIQTGQQLIAMADKALYASKEAGRNRVMHADLITVSTKVKTDLPYCVV